MTLPFKKLLVDLEDDINDLSSHDSESIDDFKEVTLKENYSFGKKRPFQTVEEELDTPIDEEGILSLVRSKHSGLFYKVSNHFNLMALTGHFSQWLSESKKIFSFQSFINPEEAFKIILALAVYYEHKENSKVLIVCEFEKFDNIFSDKLIEAKYMNTDFTMHTLGESLHFINIHDLPNSSSLEEFEEMLDDMELEFDMSYVLFPQNIHKENVNDYFKALMFKCSNINYIFDRNGTSIKDIRSARAFFEGNGIVEGGAIIGENDE